MILFGALRNKVLVLEKPPSVYMNTYRLINNNLHLIGMAPPQFLAHWSAGVKVSRHFEFDFLRKLGSHRISCGRISGLFRDGPAIFGQFDKMHGFYIRWLLISRCARMMKTWTFSEKKKSN